jgi:hypothetical protein
VLRSFVLATGVTVLLAVQGLAATVFSDDFAADAPLQSVTTVKELINFTVVGNVDVVRGLNPFGITTPGGNVIDLDGTRGAGTISSKQSQAFKAGDRVTLGMLVGGSQRTTKNLSDSLFVNFTFGDAVDVLDWTGTGHFAGLNGGDQVSVVSIGYGLDRFASDKPFDWSGMSFLAGNAGTLTFSIGTGSRDNIGPLLARVTLDITPAAVPLPATGLALLMGLGMLGAMRRKRA